MILQTSTQKEITSRSYMWNKTLTQYHWSIIKKSTTGYQNYLGWLSTPTNQKYHPNLPKGLFTNDHWDDWPGTPTSYRSDINHRHWCDLPNYQHIPWNKYQYKALHTKLVWHYSGIYDGIHTVLDRLGTVKQNIFLWIHMEETYECGINGTSNIIILYKHIHRPLQKECDNAWFFQGIFQGRYIVNQIRQG